MLNRVKMLSGAAAVALVASACQPSVYVGQAAQGGIIGAAIGCAGILAFDPSKTASNTEDCVRGATYGGLIGGAVGVYLDSQEESLSDVLHDSGTYVKRHKADEILVILPSELSFATGSASLTRGARSTLDKVASSLTYYAESMVYIDGHTDDRGSSSSNMALSVKRANAVKKYLAHQGVNRDRLVARGLGETHPLASNDTAAGRAENRRVELRIKVRD